MPSPGVADVFDSKWFAAGAFVGEIIYLTYAELTGKVDATQA